MASTMKVNSISSRSVSRAVTGQGRRTLVVRAAVAVPKEIKTVTPLGDRVVVKTVVEEARTSSGIFLPSSSQSKPNQGAVVSVAANVDGVSAGDVVVYSQYAGTEVDIDDVHHIILKNDDLVGVLAAGADVAEMKPLQDRVLIKVDEVAESTTGGLLLTGANKEQPTIGTVVAVGPGHKNGDEVTTPASTVGSKVMYQKFSGAEFEGAGGAKYIVVRDSDIIATVA
jgi:chaperonin GroES